ncbi:LuxR C-terminal-related transcriptional regulator [uncultured Cedecea sp.]|uniref:LuxR C-terminal-related transcriptional regulator n=1 Tax=uncultured Cedecea sp. TaxID=988762 RepID=UPI0026148066|nr:LuxR C-terminal-related transcriptional regulator [uncultured Cedecea sp.]
MKKTLIIFTDNSFFFLAITSLFSSSPELADKYQIYQVTSDKVDEWIHVRDIYYEVLLAGPDMEILVRFICINEGGSYFTSNCPPDKIKLVFINKLNGIKSADEKTLQVKPRVKASSRESCVLGWLLSGLTPVQIADRYGMPVKKSSQYKRQLMKKLGVTSDMEMYKAVLKYTHF